MICCSLLESEFVFTASTAFAYSMLCKVSFELHMCDISQERWNIVIFQNAPSANANNFSSQNPSL